MCIYWSIYWKLSFNFFLFLSLLILFDCYCHSSDQDKPCWTELHTESYMRTSSSPRTRDVGHFLTCHQCVSFHSPTFQHQILGGLGLSVHNQDTVFLAFFHFLVESKSGLSGLPIATCWCFLFILGYLKMFSVSLTPPQSRTRMRAARRCPSLAALRPRPSSTAPSAPPMGSAPPPLPFLPLPQHLSPPRPTRAQRRASRGGAPSRSRRGADEQAGGRGFAWLGTVVSIYSRFGSSGASSPPFGNALEMQMFSLELMKTLELAL